MGTCRNHVHQKQTVAIESRLCTLSTLRHHTLGHFWLRRSVGLSADEGVLEDTMVALRFHLAPEISVDHGRVRSCARVRHVSLCSDTMTGSI